MIQSFSVVTLQTKHLHNHAEISITPCVLSTKWPPWGSKERCPIPTLTV